MAKYDSNVKVRRRLKMASVLLAIMLVLSPLVYFFVYRPVSYNLGRSYYLNSAYDKASQLLKPFRSYKDAALVYSRVLYKSITFNYQHQNYADARKYAVMLNDRYSETSIILRDVDYMMAVDSGLRGDYLAAELWFEENLSFQNSDVLHKAAIAQDGDAFILEAENHTLPMGLSDIVDLVYIYDPPRYKINN